MMACMQLQSLFEETKSYEKDSVWGLAWYLWCCHTPYAVGLADATPRLCRTVHGEGGWHQRWGHHQRDARRQGRESAAAWRRYPRKGAGLRHTSAQVYE